MWDFGSLGYMINSKIAQAPDIMVPSITLNIPSEAASRSPTAVKGQGKAKKILKTYERRIVGTLLYYQGCKGSRILSRAFLHVVH